MVALVDRITTAPDGSQPAPTNFTFDEGSAATAEEPKFTFADRRRLAGSGWRIIERPAGRAALETADGSIDLGPLSRAYALNPGQRSYEFLPDSGDSVTLTRRRSRVAWPRFLNINWLGGQTPKWGRYVYDRLVWRKPNGATLDVVWRDEQRITNGDAWMDQYTSTPPVTTLKRGK